MTVHTSHLRARQLSDELLLAHWDLAAADYHSTRARHHLIRLLSDGGELEDLLDLIGNAITDAHDIDITAHDYAVAVLDALSANAVPMPEEKS